MINNCRNPKFNIAYSRHSDYTVFSHINYTAYNIIIQLLAAAPLATQHRCMIPFIKRSLLRDPLIRMILLVGRWSNKLRSDISMSKTESQIYIARESFDGIRYYLQYDIFNYTVRQKIIFSKYEKKIIILRSFLILIIWITTEFFQYFIYRYNKKNILKYYLNIILKY